MDITRYNQALEQAEAFKRDNNSPLLIDTLFLAFYFADRAPSAARPNKEPMPDWFKAALVTHAASLNDRSLTASQVLEIAGGGWVSPEDARRCGSWLRALGMKSRKSNGRVLFYVTGLLP